MSSITDSIFSHLKPLLNCSLLILSYYFSWQLNKIVTVNFARWLYCSRIPRTNARVPATSKKVLLLIVFLCFVSIIFLTGLRGRLFVLKSNEQKQTQSMFNKSTLKDCSGLKCVHTKMNGARSYEKFEGARNHKQLGLLKHALAFNNEKLRTTEVKESSLAIKNIVSCFSHCFLLCRYILWWILGSLGITLNSDARVIFKSLIGSAEDKISVVSAS